MVRADSHEAAANLLENHPHFTIFFPRRFRRNHAGLADAGGSSAVASRGLSRAVLKSIARVRLPSLVTFGELTGIVSKIVRQNEFENEMIRGVVEARSYTHLNAQHFGVDVDNTKQ